MMISNNSPGMYHNGFFMRDSAIVFRSNDVIAPYHKPLSPFPELAPLWKRLFFLCCVFFDVNTHVSCFSPPDAV